MVKETWQDRQNRTWEERRARAERRARVNRIRAVVMRGAIAVLSRLSVRSAVRLGECIGRFAFSLSPTARHRSLIQVAAALGDRHSPDRCREIALHSVQQLGASVLEWMVYCRMGPERAAKSVVAVRAGSTSRVPSRTAAGSLS